MVFGQEVSHDASLRYHILPGSNTMILPVIIFWQILCPRQKVSNSSVNHSTVCFARLCTRPLSRLARSCTRLLSRFALLYKATSFAATNIAKWIVAFQSQLTFCTISTTRMPIFTTLQIFGFASHFRRRKKGISGDFTYYVCCSTTTGGLEFSPKTFSNSSRTAIEFDVRCWLDVFHQGDSWLSRWFYSRRTILCMIIIFN